MEDESRSVRNQGCKIFLTFRMRRSSSCNVNVNEESSSLMALAFGSGIAFRTISG